MNRAGVKDDREGSVFSINHYIKWPKATHGSLDIWKVKLSRTECVVSLYAFKSHKGGKSYYSTVC